MNARRSRPKLPRFDHSTSRLFDQSTSLLPAASCLLPAVCGAGSMSEFAIGIRTMRGHGCTERRFSSKDQRLLFQVWAAVGSRSVVGCRLPAASCQLFLGCRPTPHGGSPYTAEHRFSLEEPCLVLREGATQIGSAANFVRQSHVPPHLQIHFPAQGGSRFLMEMLTPGISLEPPL